MATFAGPKKRSQFLEWRRMPRSAKDVLFFISSPSFLFRFFLAPMENGLYNRKDAKIMFFVLGCTAGAKSYAL